MQSKTSTCVDCGVAVSGRGDRCRSCAATHRWGVSRERLPIPNASGQCMCGCGQSSPISKSTVTRLGLVKGFPCRYVRGHGPRAERREKTCADCGTPISKHAHARCFPCAMEHRAAMNPPQAPKMPKPRKPARDSVIAYRIEDRGHETPCWIWDGLCDERGYCRAYRAGKAFWAHRFVYEQLRAPISPGLTIDHLCRVRSCVNPAHLEPVTLAENIRRGSGPSAIAVRTNQCKRGHQFTLENTYVGKDGRRSCRACGAWRARQKRLRLRG